jgi:hypothetical protein
MDPPRDTSYLYKTAAESGVVGKSVRQKSLAAESSECLLSIPAVQWYLMTGGNWPKFVIQLTGKNRPKPDCRKLAISVFAHIPKR